MRPVARLDEFDKDEWRDVARRVRPDLEDEEFDILWEDFQREKEARLRNREMN